MTPEQQRIAIAEACGWKHIPADNVGASARLFYGDVWWRDAENNTIASIDQLPDYPTDLNAMHEAEKAIPDDKIDEYKHRLCVVTTTKERITQCATASQRAEAFLKTLNLWKP